MNSQASSGCSLVEAIDHAPPAGVMPRPARGAFGHCHNVEIKLVANPVSRALRAPRAFEGHGNEAIREGLQPFWRRACFGVDAFVAHCFEELERCKIFGRIDHTLGLIFIKDSTTIGLQNAKPRANSTGRWCSAPNA